MPKSMTLRFDDVIIYHTYNPLQIIAFASCNVSNSIACAISIEYPERALGEKCTTCIQDAKNCETPRILNKTAPIRLLKKLTTYWICRAGPGVNIRYHYSLVWRLWNSRLFHTSALPLLEWNCGALDNLEVSASLLIVHWIPITAN